MSDREAMDIRENFIKRIWRQGYERKPVSELIETAREVKAEELADSLQAWIDIWEAEREQ